MEEISENIRSREIERESINKKLKDKQTALGELREKLGEKSFEARQMELDLKQSRLGVKKAKY